MPLEEGLALRDVLPLSWQEANAPLGDLQLAYLNESNESVLRVISLLEEHRPEGVDEHGGISAELVRLDNKINMLLDLVNRLLQFHINLPPAVPVTLTIGNMEWRSKEAPPAGSLITVQLYLHASYPIPLRLPASVQAVEDRDGEKCVQVVLAGLSGPVSDRLEKLLFRHHRRAVAHARRAMAEQQSDDA